jgi:hypothetical protein
MPNTTLGCSITRTTAQVPRPRRVSGMIYTKGCQWFPPSCPFDPGSPTGVVYLPEG